MLYNTLCSLCLGKTVKVKKMLEGKPEGAGVATSLRSLLIINTTHEIYYAFLLKPVV